MKGDFTLTGKRTFNGILNDGKISLNRYFINNFKDGYYQDWLNFGNGAISPLTFKMKTHKICKYIILLLCLLVFFVFIA